MTPQHAAHAEPALEASPADREAARRALKVRLLRDLVGNGLYRIDHDALAERLLPVLRPER